MTRLLQATDAAVQVDRLAGALLLACSLMAAVVFGLLLYCLIRYHRGSGASRRTSGIAEWKFEVTWITFTTAVFLGFFFWGARLFVRSESPPPGAEEIRVVGRQWMWDIRQPNGHREFNTLHVPIGRPVTLRLASEDVIHSFFVPAFRVKQDVVPGKETALWFNVNRPGEYPFFCSEFCGSKHAEMIGTIIAQSPADYDRWLSGNPAPGGPLAAGQQVYLRYGCTSCHAPDAKVRAPDLAGAGSRRTAAALRQAIYHPDPSRQAGYPALMPSFAGVISEREMSDLIAYLSAPSRP
jgi:cytochrome c oxidase subunit 2